MKQQQTTTKTMTTTTSHSNMLSDFKGWLAKWDDRIVTQDDVETQFIIQQKLLKGFTTIEKLLSESDKKVMIKARGNLSPGSNESNEKEVMAMFENQKKPWYKNLQNTSYDLTYIRSILDNVYEIKNRRSRECFQLRAENAKLRQEILKLKNEKE